jgi:hypothetical protein
MNDASAKRLPGPAQGTRSARAKHLIITDRLARRPARAPARIILRLRRGRVAQPAQGRSRQATKPAGQRPAPTAPSSPGTSIAFPWFLDILSFNTCSGSLSQELIPTPRTPPDKTRNIGKPSLAAAARNSLISLASSIHCTIESRFIMVTKRPLVLCRSTHPLATENASGLRWPLNSSIASRRTGSHGI